ncbi:hypothetical protein Ancab_006672 [Ancistrocladus abbreviatus]
MVQRMEYGDKKPQRAFPRGCMEFQTGEQDYEWLKDCYVCEVALLECVPGLNEKLWNASFQCCKVRPLGGRKKRWIRVFGIPLHVWTWEFFRKVVSEWGEIITMDAQTRNRERSNFAQLYVYSTSPDFILENIRVKVDDESF